ncbi:MAG: hypothetical protein ACJZ78_05035 [Prochlorococcus marinus]
MTQQIQRQVADETDLFVGVDYEVGPGTLSAAWNSTEVDGRSDNLDIIRI